MKVLACNNFQKIKIKRMENALPVHADHVENPERWKPHVSYSPHLFPCYFFSFKQRGLMS